MKCLVLDNKKENYNIIASKLSKFMEVEFSNSIHQSLINISDSIQFNKPITIIFANIDLNINNPLEFMIGVRKIDIKSNILLIGFTNSDIIASSLDICCKEQDKFTTSPISTKFLEELIIDLKL